MTVGRADWLAGLLEAILVNGRLDCRCFLAAPNPKSNHQRERRPGTR
jgi:hypothetical protein